MNLWAWLWRGFRSAPPSQIEIDFIKDRLTLSVAEDTFEAHDKAGRIPRYGPTPFPPPRQIGDGD
mgnify:CR=1 FL=1